MPAATTDTLAFIRRLLDIEDAWAALSVMGVTRDRVLEAARQGRGCTPIIVRAAEVLTQQGDGPAATSLLLDEVRLTAPPAPLQLALARRLIVQGDPPAARAWFHGGMLRARADAALALELACIELAAGQGRCAEALVAVAGKLPCNAPADAARSGFTLASAGRRDLARAACLIALDRGYREEGFLRAFAGLLRDEPGELQRRVASLAVHARLAAHHVTPAAIGRAAEREESARWVPLGRLAGFLRERIASRRPFAWIRLSDGEARFLLYMHPELRAPIGDEDAVAIIDALWSVWFGRDVRAEDRHRLAWLADLLDRAIVNADLLGVTSAARLRGDRSHGGFCAAMEPHIDALTRSSGARQFTAAMDNYQLNAADPFLEQLLGGLDFLGVISPHPELAGRLQARLGIGATASYDIPGEGRLNRAREHADRGTHFPAVFERILRDLVVPHEGAVFIVAGGLLGKIYCDHVRRLGGIALDIGAVVDAWMGFDTRDGLLDTSPGSVLPPANG